MKREYHYFQVTDEEVEPQTTCDLPWEMSHYLQCMTSVCLGASGSEPMSLDSSHPGLYPCEHLKLYAVLSVFPYLF